MITPARWQPIIDGDLAVRMTDSIHEIAAAVRERSEVDRAGPTLSGGTAGLATFYTYLGEAFPDRDDYRATAEQLIDQAVEAVAEVPLPAALYGGFTGVAWAYEHLQGRLFEIGDDLNEGIDHTVAQLLETTPWPFSYDLISGLVGFGVYALERQTRPLAATMAERVVARLAEMAEEQDGGLTWLTPAALMIPETAATHPDGYYNLGLAHGVPGVTAVLGKICGAELGGPRARRLLDGSVAWLLAHRRSSEGPRFSYHVDPRSDESPPSRSAWCYGDPGAAAALLVAARAVRQEEWARIAIQTAAADTRRPADHTGVVDAGLCHGSAGLAHIYNRFYQATGEEAFRDGARRWFERTLELRRQGGIAGYLAWWPSFRKDGPKSSEWRPETGFLTGAAGVGLAMLAAVSTVEPAWDRLLLVDIPPR